MPSQLYKKEGLGFRNVQNLWDAGWQDHAAQGVAPQWLQLFSSHVCDLGQNFDTSWPVLLSVKSVPLMGSPDDMSLFPTRLEDKNGPPHPTF